MKIPCIVASAALAAFALPSHAAPFSSFDIGDTAGLERLKRERPTHYLAVSEAIRVASRLPCRETELQVLKVRYDVREMACGFIVKTSYPAKRHITFVVENTRYEGNVILEDADARLMPARGARPATQAPR